MVEIIIVKPHNHQYKRHHLTFIATFIQKDGTFMLERFFDLKAHNSSAGTEIMAGVSTFLTMAFIIAVNPAILSDAGIDFASAFIATIAATILGTLIMGLYAKWPVAVAPGMGLNAYFAYVVVLGYGLSFQQALAAIFISSVAFFIFSLSRIRGWLITSIPSSLQIGITAGIGLFLALIGLTGANIIVANPDTIVGFGDISQSDVILSLIALVMMAGLEARGIRGGILISIIVITVIGWSLGLAEFSGIMALPVASSAAFSLDFSALATPAFLSIVFVMFFVDFFDTTGTLTAIAGPAGKRREDGSIDGLDKAVLADTSASIFGSLLGTSTLTTYLESAAGIKAGGRTGLTAVVVAALFALCLFFEPLFASIPAYATAPALIYVAFSFLSGLKHVTWSDTADALPVMVMMVIMPLSFSIAAGISLGFLAYVGIRLLAGRAQEITGGIWLVTLFGVIWLILNQL